MEKCIDLFLKHRIDAGVDEDNPYVFGLRNDVDGFKWIDAGPLLRKYAKECGAEFPELLRGTRLRKHVATVGISLNLSDGQIDNLSKFMGHDKTIHLNIYRQPVGTSDILEVSQFLEKAPTDFADRGNERILYEEESTSDIEEDQNGEDEKDIYEEEQTFCTGNSNVNRNSDVMENLDVMETSDPEDDYQKKESKNKRRTTTTKIGT